MDRTLMFGGKPMICVMVILSRVNAGHNPRKYVILITSMISSGILSSKIVQQS